MGKIMDKLKLKDKMGRPLTQSLFLENGYKTQFAVYTLKEEDYEYEGKLYPSIHRLYIECADPTEYEFANKYFLGWSHWLRIVENNLMKKHIRAWREELEVKLRYEGVKMVHELAKAGHAQSARWLADRGWDKRAAGRPSNEEVEREKKIAAGIEDEFTADIIRLKEAK